jgi:carbon-monoxide dehydrogenase small subunit
MMMTARALLNRDPSPTEPEIREAISGQICRCTGYATIVRSIQWAAAHEAARSAEAEVSEVTVSAAGAS